jgi:hypothetical protein
MGVEILVAQGEGVDALGEQGALVVDDEEWMARVGDRRVEGVEEFESVAGLTEQVRAGVDSRKMVGACRSQKHCL